MFTVVPEQQSGGGGGGTMNGSSYKGSGSFVCPAGNLNTLGYLADNPIAIAANRIGYPAPGGTTKAFLVTNIPAGENQLVTNNVVVRLLKDGNPTGIVITYTPGQVGIQQDLALVSLIAGTDDFDVEVTHTGANGDVGKKVFISYTLLLF